MSIIVRRGALKAAVWVACAALWLGAVAAGARVLIAHASTPGPVVRAPAHFPENSGIEPDRSRPTLLVFAHPQCPCTSATLGELAELLAEAPSAASVHVLFVQPRHTTDGWTEADLWASAEAMPGVRVARDPDGVIASRFGAQTSGVALLYDIEGDLLFSGGITGSRGHAGDNAGREALTRALVETGFSSEGNPVFGCSLVDRACEDAAFSHVTHVH